MTTCPVASKFGKKTAIGQAEQDPNLPRSASNVLEPMLHPAIITFLNQTIANMYCYALYHFRHCLSIVIVEELEPEARSGHRIIVDENHNIYSIGGYNPDFWDVDNDEESIYPLFREVRNSSFHLKRYTGLSTPCRGFIKFHSIL